jgi:heat shock protein HtpX
MTLERPPVMRRKDLGPPDVLTLETDLERQTARRRATAMSATFVLVAALEGLIVGWIVHALWLVIALAVLAAAYTTVLRAAGGRWLARLLRAEPARNPRLNRYGVNLAAAASVATPRVLVVRGDTPNAFAIGLEPRAIVGTTGALNLADLTLEALVAHETVHIRDGDAMLTSLYLALTRVLALVGRGVVAALLAVPVLPASVVIAALRPVWFPADHEHRADVAAALLTRYPPGVATALRSAEGAAAPGPRAAARFWFAPADDERARLIDEM